MNAKDEKRAAFNEQMNEWVSRQGLWFQLRHAADGQTLIARVMRVVLRLAIIMIIVSLGCWLYLVKRVESEGFNEDIRSSVEKTLKGTDCEIGPIHKERDDVTIAYLKIKGTDESFFHDLKARQVRFKMKVTDGILGQWNGGGITATQIDMFVKAGASDAPSAAKSYRSLFDDYGRFSFDRIESDATNVRWGYSGNNRGSISDSHMTAIRDDDGWIVEFKGGTFSQNWLHDLNITRMLVVCDKDGVHIREAELHRGGGTLSFKLNVGSGGQPQVSGIVTLKSMPLKSLLSPQYSDRIEGKISGKGKITGSTNSQEGIVMDIDLSIEDGDVIVIRDDFPLLDALSIVDLYSNYRKISFTEGGCHIRTGGDLLQVTNIDLKAGDLFHLAGEIHVRPPSYVEIAKSLNIKDVKIVRDVIEKNWELGNELLGSMDEDTTVADAAKGVGDVEAGGDATKKNSMKNVRKISILAEKNVRRFGGIVKVGLKKDAFDKAPLLKEAYPVDAATGRIWLDVPLAGRLPTLTLSLAEKLYKLGKEHK